MPTNKLLKANIPAVKSLLHVAQIVKIKEINEKSRM
jgi:hypothetical protein